MTDYEKLTPEEADVRNQAMLQDLEHMYAPVDEAQSLERIRNRLLATEHSSSFNSIQATEQLMRKTKRERFQLMNGIQVPIAHKKVRYLNILVASIVAALIIGSLLFEVTHVYQGSTGGAGSPRGSVSTYGPNWKVLATFKGTGSKIITDQHLVFKHVFAAWFTCTGKGATSVLFDTLHGKGFKSICHVEASSKFNYKLFSGISSSTIEKIYIVVDRNSSWELQLANCVGNETACGYPVGAPTPTPPPTAMPTPTPTVPPTPTSTPGAIPTPMPTVLPVPTPTPAH